jgi:hypothetical protein
MSKKPKVWGICYFCGWQLTYEGMKDNSWMPYCCGDAEQAYIINGFARTAKEGK